MVKLGEIKSNHSRLGADVATSIHLEALENGNDTFLWLWGDTLVGKMTKHGKRKISVGYQVKVFLPALANASKLYWNCTF